MATRPIAPLPLPAGVVPGMPETAEPELMWIEPAKLRVDDAYQRDLSERSVRLIYQIVKDFDWRKLKPAVVAPAADAPGFYDVLDGQHTAIGAASHGGIDRIPCVVVAAAAAEDRAKAFLAHNRDRVAMQASQLFYAALAAGDEDALTIKQVCDRAGAKILKLPPSRGTFSIGETMAVSTLKRLVNTRSAQKARIVVETCVKAGAAPVTAEMLRAVDELLHGRDYAGEIEPDNLVVTLKRLDEFSGRITEMSLAKKMPRWRAAVIVLFQHTRKTRRATS